jgi:hypothetical protein
MMPAMPKRAARTRIRAAGRALLAALVLTGIAPVTAHAHSLPVAYSVVAVEDTALAWDLRVPIDAALCEIETPGFSREELLALGAGLIPTLPENLDEMLIVGLPLWTDYIRNTLHVMNDGQVADAMIEGFTRLAPGEVTFRLRHEWGGRPLGTVAIRSSLLLDLDPAYVNLAAFRRGEESAQTVFSASQREWSFDARAPLAAARGTSHAGGGGFGRFVHLGSLHIAGDLPGVLAAIRGQRAPGAPPLGWNFDHLLFVLGLLVAVDSLPSLVKVVTAFTAAHTITLGLSALGVLSIPQRAADIAVALTLVVVGVQNLAAGPPRRRPLVAFLLGLVHGFAFAEVLRGLPLTRWALAGSLLGFNLGVELGQLAIVLVAYPLLALARRDPERGPARALAIRRIGSLVVALAGLAWLIQRTAPLLL